MEPFAAHMVRDHARFAGRWSEIQHVCAALDRRSPALVIGPPQSGRSSLLYHLVHAAPALFDEPAMQSYYIDLQTCPDIATLRATIASAFHQPPARWQAYLVEVTTPPLLAFDTCDAPQLADTLPSWWHELLPLVRDGRLRIIATAVQSPVSDMPWQVVPIQRVDGPMLDDIVSAQLGDDGPRLSRADHTWMLQHSQGHIGVLMACLRAWYRAYPTPGQAWRATVSRQSGDATVLAPPDSAAALASEWYVSDADTAQLPVTADAQSAPYGTSPAVVFEVPGILWVIAVICMVVLGWLLWWGAL